MIQINLLRISSDSKHLEFSVECPSNYHFTTLIVRKYDNVKEFIDLSNLFQTPKSKYVVRIPVEIIGGASMYYVHFGIALNEGEEPTVDPCNPSLTADGVCSDVANVYRYLLHQLLTLYCDGCLRDIPVEIQQLFTILFAHIQAMKYEQYEEAEQFYDVIKQNYQNCEPIAIKSTEGFSCNCRRVDNGRV